jgi:hypothetical protein
MPNDIAGTPGQLIARRALETLLESFPVLRLFSADFSAEQGLFGQTIQCQIPVAFSAADDYDTTDGYEPQDVDTVDCPVVLNQHKHVTYCFNDQEVNSTNVDLVERFARNAAHAIGLSMLTEIFKLITTTNYTNESAVISTDFFSGSLVAVNSKLTTRKVPSLGRFGMLNSDYIAELFGDAQVVANPGDARDTLHTGQLGRIHGINVFEYPALPNNSENLVGFVCTPESILLATRIPQIPVNAPGDISVVVEPNSGIGLQVRQWYDFKLGKTFRTFTLMFGVAKGNVDCLERIVSAANT